ncbi:hypothetical protein TU62_01845 [Bacillus cereus]|nr:hypothetical protein TU62_01845 [Bacillus cereus]
MTIQVLGLKFVKTAGPIIFPDLPVTVTTSPGCKFLKILHIPPEQRNKLHKNKFVPPLNNILYHMKVCRRMCRQVTFRREEFKLKNMIEIKKDILMNAKIIDRIKTI